MRERSPTSRRDTRRSRLSDLSLLVELGSEVFPDPRTAPADGLVALGGNYNADLLLLAYSRGIFPWPHPDHPHAWFSPDPRLVLRPDALHVSRSLRRLLRADAFDVTMDQAFAAVMSACSRSNAPSDEQVWITPEYQDGFLELHELGLAHSVEVWDGGLLVGGLYGLALGTMFCGESMFHLTSNASKVALAHLVRWMLEQGLELIDCQLTTEHLLSLGAEEWPRARFLDCLRDSLKKPTLVGRWSLDQSTPTW